MSKEISLATVKEHNTPNDLWLIIENKVYDVTKFRLEHPGGEDSLLDVAGRDGTKEFNDVGHSSEAREILKKYYIGNLAAADISKKRVQLVPRPLKRAMRPPPPPSNAAYCINLPKVPSC
ncbi:cytochrome b5 isoform X2 [Drosophila serrata]|uniref:cytochrome b5 isoform X2 n=1 Tax=Drosophila serrata TaxID=7274 RepID=UPI000A1D1313|nr:cytochrome b5 isoform X2 [Drosophila serrata]